MEQPWKLVQVAPWVQEAEAKQKQYIPPPLAIRVLGVCGSEDRTAADLPAFVVDAVQSLGRCPPLPHRKHFDMPPIGEEEEMKECLAGRSDGWAYDATACLEGEVLPMEAVRDCWADMMAVRLTLAETTPKAFSSKIDRSCA